MTEIHTSEEIGEIAAALAKAQAEIENVEKTGANPAFKRGNEPSRYTTLGSALDEVRQKFAQQGIAILQMPINGEGSNIGVVTRFAHSSGQWIESALYVAPQRFDAQGAGSVITYLRRYALMAMAGIAPEDDDGEAAVGRPAAPQPRPITAAPAERGAAATSTERSHTRSSTGNGTNGSGLPPNPAEPPEVAAARNRVRDLIAKINGHIKTAPNDHALDLAWDDAREEVKEIEAAGPAGIEAANTLRARYNRRVSELRGGAAA